MGALTFCEATKRKGSSVKQDWEVRRRLSQILTSYQFTGDLLEVASTSFAKFLMPKHQEMEPMVGIDRLFQRLQFNMPDSIGDSSIIGFIRTYLF
jgi:hypothetical protein